MIQKMELPVSVMSFFDHRKKAYVLIKVIFDGEEHEIVKTGFHHTYRQGRTLMHVFSVVSRSTFFRLVHNTDNLSWRLEEVGDGEVG